MTSRSRYCEDDFVAFLAYVGPPANYDRTMKNLELRLDQIQLAEEFCQSWFAGKPIDGQWAGFYTAYQNWYKNKGGSHGP